MKKKVRASSSSHSYFLRTRFRGEKKESTKVKIGRAQQPHCLHSHISHALFLLGRDQWNLVAGYVVLLETRLRERCFSVATPHVGYGTM